MFMLPHGETQVLLTVAAEICNIHKCWLARNTQGTYGHCYTYRN